MFLAGNSSGYLGGEERETGKEFRSLSNVLLQVVKEDGRENHVKNSITRED